MDEVAFGRYRLIEVIGEGGMGTVYRAHDTVIGRDVAIKVLPTELAREPGYRERFRREAHTAARLTDPHIIPIHDTGEIDGRLFLVMPIIKGTDVQTLLKRDGSMTPERAVRVVEQLAAALDAAHAHGLVHRDVKPSNALITSNEFVYLIDFGIAHDGAAAKLTQTGSTVGTWAYMAPERFNIGTADARADVYALACVLYECLTGQVPYPGDSLEQQIAAHLTRKPPKPTTVNSAVPAGFDEVIARGMAKDPDRRYQTAQELAAAARHALTDGPAAAQSPTAPKNLDFTTPAPGVSQPTLPAAPSDPRRAARQPHALGEPAQRASAVPYRRPQPTPPRVPPPARGTLAGYRPPIVPEDFPPATVPAGPADQSSGIGARVSARRRRKPWIISGAAVLVLVVVGLIIGHFIIMGRYYVAERGGGDGQVSIMRGIPGYPLRDEYLIGCVKENQIIAEDAWPNGCRPLRVIDLQEPSRKAVVAGLPTGSLDDAKQQMQNLMLLEPCPPLFRPTPTPLPPTTMPTASPSPAPAPTPPSPRPQQPGTDCRTVA